MNVPFSLPCYVGIILQEKEKLFLVQRRNTNWAEGCWNFPGGLIEKNEAPKIAAAREIYEEVGVIVNPADFKFVQVLYVHKNETNTQDIIGFYFKTTTWQGVPRNNEPDKIIVAQWFDLDSLPQNITEHAISAIEGITKNVYYAESGW
jgi:8-oxo-dGTP pyrophosphatase MutT (NUDIX family)